MVDGKIAIKDAVRVPLNGPTYKGSDKIIDGANFKMTPEQQQDLEALYSRRTRLMKVRDNHKDNKQLYDMINGGHINPTSGKIGERTADIYIENNYEGFKRIYPPDLATSTSKSGDFDLVYKNDAGDVIIVEAKGGKNAPLNKKNIDGEDYQQGTTEYFAETTKQMAEREAKSGDSAEKIASIKAENDATLEIIDATEKGKVRYLKIEAKLANTPTTLKQVKEQTFDIDLSKAADRF